MKKIVYILTIIFIVIFFTLITINFDEIKDYILYKNPIKVILITDKNYVTQTKTVIKSINANKAPKTKLEINVLTVGLDKQDYKKIKKEQKLKTRINIIPCKIERKDLPSSSKDNPDVTRADYLKFNLATILAKTDKVLYLDGDVIVLKDLTELYNTDIEDYYAAAAQDLESTWIDKRKEPYFNNGVMLINLKKMREDNIETKLINYKKNDKINRFMTQDAFNTVLYKKVKFIPLIYDTFAPEYNDENILKIIKKVLNKNYDEKIYPYKTAQEYRNAVVIIHYTGWYNVKPWYEWADKNSATSKIWYKYSDEKQ